MADCGNGCPGQAAGKAGRLFCALKQCVHCSNAAPFLAAVATAVQEAAKQAGCKVLTAENMAAAIAAGRAAGQWAAFEAALPAVKESLAARAAGAGAAFAVPFHCPFTPFLRKTSATLPPTVRREGKGRGGCRAVGLPGRQDRPGDGR